MTAIINTMIFKDYINVNELRTIINNTFGNNPSITNVDTTYALMKLPFINMLINSAKVDELKYIPQKFDCDDFTAVLLGKERKQFRKTITTKPCGSAFGMVHSTKDGSGHAQCFFIDIDKKIFIIEPQTGIMFEPKQDRLYHFVYI